MDGHRVQLSSFVGSGPGMFCLYLCPSVLSWRLQVSLIKYDALPSESTPSFCFCNSESPESGQPIISLQLRSSWSSNEYTIAHSRPSLTLERASCFQELAVWALGKGKEGTGRSAQLPLPWSVPLGNILICTSFCSREQAEDIPRIGLQFLSILPPTRSFISISKN